MTYSDFINRLLRDGEKMTTVQGYWASLLYEVWQAAEGVGQGSGKSWFWIRFVSFLQRADHGVHLWMNQVARAKYANGELGWYDRVTGEWE